MTTITLAGMFSMTDDRAAGESTGRRDGVVPAAATGSPPGGEPAREVLGRLAAGDRDGALALVVERTRDSLYRFLVHMVRDREAARDIFQDTYVRVFQALGGYRGDASLTTWVLAIGRNVALNRIRRGKVRDRHHVPFEEGAETAAPGAAEPSSRALAAALAGLPQTQREAVLLFYVEDLPVAEVARLTDRPVNTVKSDLLRARRHLRAALEGGTRPADSVEWEGP